ncbi:methyltransferase domain-containing protein [Cryptosporangium arvum]|uniref:methyltransferase domain-containing protein n=1 Tax=Cryptosporangium arvum TaxID=80871 RepID=UPI0004AE938D|nr:methyltransferase domain-containing protein [Cryptosporangium arvum]
MAFVQWDPAIYLRRAPERARPFFELVARIGAEPGDVRSVVDLGCGPGTLTASLADRYPAARITGLDSSAAMIAGAPAGDRLTFGVTDATTWRPSVTDDVVISNAMLQWIPRHPDLLTRWATDLRPGAWLAVQVPGNYHAPSHATVRELKAERNLTTDEPGPVLDPAGYAERLPGCVVDAWETTYLHHLPADGDAHPVRTWLEGTTLRPVVAALPADEYAGLAAALDERLHADYPVTGGHVRYPFRRVFVVAAKARP